jgi:hypothetical protein
LGAGGCETQNYQTDGWQEGCELYVVFTMQSQSGANVQKLMRVASDFSLQKELDGIISHKANPLVHCPLGFGGFFPRVNPAGSLFYASGQKATQRGQKGPS